MMTEIDYDLKFHVLNALATIPRSEKIEDDFVDRCCQMCIKYNLTAPELVIEINGFLAKHERLKLSMKNVDLVERDVKKSLKRQNRYTALTELKKTMRANKRLRLLNSSNTAEGLATKSDEDNDDRLSEDSDSPSEGAVKNTNTASSSTSYAASTTAITTIATTTTKDEVIYGMPSTDSSLTTSAISSNTTVLAMDNVSSLALKDETALYSQKGLQAHVKVIIEYEEAKRFKPLYYITSQNYMKCFPFCSTANSAGPSHLDTNNYCSSPLKLLIKIIRTKTHAHPFNLYDLGIIGSFTSTNDFPKIDKKTQTFGVIDTVLPDLVTGDESSGSDEDKVVTSSCIAIFNRNRTPWKLPNIASTASSSAVPVPSYVFCSTLLLPLAALENTASTSIINNDHLAITSFHTPIFQVQMYDSSDNGNVPIEAAI